MADAYGAGEGPKFDAQRTPAEGAADNDDLLDRFAKWNVALMGHWSQWREQALVWYSFVGGDQWTAPERAEMEAAQKIAVEFNLIGPVIDAVQGAEIQNRQQVQFYPREVGDTGVSDVLTQGADFVTDECNGDQEDSEAFWDTLVCGLGWTETRPEIDDDQVNLIKERVDPLQMWADPAARKRCLEDMRYLKREIPMSPDEFEDFKAEIGREDIEGTEGVGLDDGKRLTVVNPATRYTSGMLGAGDAPDTVIVCEWQWWDREPVYLAGMPGPDGVVKITSMPKENLDAALQADPTLRYSESHKKVFYRAFATDAELLFKEELKEGDFRYKCITGKRDRNDGTWFGLVKPQMDPQRFVNKLYSEILHIVRTNANGGMALEEDAVDDVRSFEATWAATDKITWLKSGSLSGAHGAKMVAEVASGGPGRAVPVDGIRPRHGEGLYRRERGDSGPRAARTGRGAGGAAQTGRLRDSLGLLRRETPLSAQPGPPAAGGNARVFPAGQAGPDCRSGFGAIRPARASSGDSNLRYRGR